MIQFLKIKKYLPIFLIFFMIIIFSVFYLQITAKNYPYIENLNATDFMVFNGNYLQLKTSDGFIKKQWPAKAGKPS